MEPAPDSPAETLDEVPRPGPGSRSRYEAEYELESPARCPSCQAHLSWIGVVRLLRSRVNFTSTLPRRGYVIVCPRCHALLPAELRGLTV
jgi:ribosomal protein L34E